MNVANMSRASPALSLHQESHSYASPCCTMLLQRTPQTTHACHVITMLRCATQHFAGYSQWFTHQFWAVDIKSQRLNSQTFKWVAQCARGLKVWLRKKTATAPDMHSNLTAFSRLHKPKHVDKNQQIQCPSTFLTYWKKFAHKHINKCR